MTVAMDCFAAELAGPLRHVALAARALGGGLAAPPRARLPAGGTEVTGHRDYAPGDDIRQVDWNICARHDELVVKQYRGQADWCFYVLVDVSASMQLGRPPKSEVARRAAAALVYVALDQMARVTVLAVTDRVVGRSPAVRHTGRFATLLRFLERLEPTEAQTDLRASALQFIHSTQRPGPTAVISDFYDPGGFEAALELLRHSGCEPRPVRIYDPCEAAPPWLGETELVDVESGQRWQLVITRRDLQRYKRLMEEHDRAVAHYAARYRLRWTQIPVDGVTAEDVLMRAVGLRWRR
ncbi:MAG TPA: DUF58 domain-containing protein [Planctomycetaceae bacterium]|nr:DUF58 domain-containing protein [Planctomycetaceae bacterium]